MKAKLLCSLFSVALLFGCSENNFSSYDEEGKTEFDYSGPTEIELNRTKPFDFEMIGGDNKAEIQIEDSSIVEISSGTITGKHLGTTGILFSNRSQSFRIQIQVVEPSISEESLTINNNFSFSETIRCDGETESVKGIVYPQGFFLQADYAGETHILDCFYDDGKACHVYESDDHSKYYYSRDDYEEVWTEYGLTRLFDIGSQIKLLDWNFISSSSENGTITDVFQTEDLFEIPTTLGGLADETTLSFTDGVLTGMRNQVYEPQESCEVSFYDIGTSIMPHASPICR